MITRYDYQGVTWIDLECPTAEEIEEVEKELSLAPMLAQDLLAPTPKPRVDVYPECVYAVLHFLALRQTRERSVTHEVDIVLGKKFLISVHYEPMGSIQDFSRALEAASLLTRAGGKLHAGHLFIELAQRLYREAENELDALEGAIGNIESAIFSGKEREMVSTISNASRELLAHRRILGGHEQTLIAFESAGVNLFGESFRPYLQGASAFHFRAHNRAIALNDTLNELRETNMALLYTRQNEIMKNLTILAFVTFPLSLIAGIFGMNTDFTPIADHPHGFWIILGGMFALTALFFAYFKLRRWF